MKATHWAAVLASSMLLLSPPSSAQEGRTADQGQMPAMQGRRQAMPRKAPQPVRVSIQRTTETETWTGEQFRGVETEMLIRDAEGRVRRELPRGSVEIRLPGQGPIFLDPARRTFQDTNRPRPPQDPKKLAEMEVKAREAADRILKDRKGKGFKPGQPHMVESHSKGYEDLPEQTLGERKMIGKRLVTTYNEGPVQESSREVWRDKESGQILRSIDVHRFSEEAQMGSAERPIKTRTTTTEYLYMDTRSIDPKLFEIPKSYTAE